MDGDPLAEFRTQEAEADRISASALVVTNDECRRVFIAWELNPCHMPEERCPETDKRLRWRWFWDNCRIDYVTLAESAGIAMSRAERLVRMLAGVGAIYPDGTVNGQVKAFLRANLAKLLPARQRRNE